MFITIQEIIDIVFMSIIIGYILESFFKFNTTQNEFVSFWTKLKYSIIIAAPAIILHEFGHKFVAMGFGHTATFGAAYYFLLFGAILKLVGSPILFFVPAYVSIPIGIIPWQSGLIAFAGPFVNFIIWRISNYLFYYRKYKTKTQGMLLFYSMNINKILFYFNMIPFPGFDGYHIVTAILSYL